MYPTLIELKFAFKLIVICLCPCLINIIWWCRVSGGTFFIHGIHSILVRR